MPEERIHRAVSADGTEIAGRVRGQGPPLVLVHGGIGDGEIAWEALLPHLTDRFTCYLPSTRGRGLSADNPDHSPPRLEEDVTAFVDSIGEPVCLVGWSGSGAWVLGAAARSASVAAVAAYEPGRDLGDGRGRPRPNLRRHGAGGCGGCRRPARRCGARVRPVDLHRRRDRRPGADGLLRTMGGRRPGACSGSSSRTRPTRGPVDRPRGARQVAAPVLLLRGEQTRLGTFFADAAQLHRPARPRRRRSAKCLASGTSRQLLAPEAIAEELITFFESVRQPA